MPVVEEQPAKAMFSANVPMWKQPTYPAHPDIVSSSFQEERPASFAPPRPSRGPSQRGSMEPVMRPPIIPRNDDLFVERKNVYPGHHGATTTRYRDTQ